MDAVAGKYWTQAVGNQCYFTPIVELWGISLVTLLQPLASICVKLIGKKKKGGGVGWNQAFLDHLGHQASHLAHED